MKTYTVFCALALVVFVMATSVSAASPYTKKDTIMGEINSRGELVADDSQVFVITNFRNLGNDWAGQEVEVTGYISKGTTVPSKNGTPRNAIQIILYHVIGTPTWWDNCVVSCEPYNLY